MQLYAIQYRQKKDKTVYKSLFMAKNLKSAIQKVMAFQEDEDNEVDKRTVKWAGEAVPLLIGYEEDYSFDQFIGLDSI